MRSCALFDVGLGRRVFQKLEMDAEFEGSVEATGEDYSAKSTYVMGEIVGHLSSLRLVIFCNVLLHLCFVNYGFNL